MQNNNEFSQPEMYQRSALERHAQTVITAIVLAVLMWVAQSVVDLRDRVIRFEEKITNLQAQVNVGTDDRFRKSDWVREKERLDERFIALKNQVDKHAERIDRLERLKEKFHGDK
jgi:hypothetical protein